jgi:hypothetical protein
METSVLTRATRLNIPEDAILQSHRRENLKSYILFSTMNSESYSSVRCSYQAVEAYRLVTH